MEIEELIGGILIGIIITLGAYMIITEINFGNKCQRMGGIVVSYSCWDNNSKTFIDSI